MNLDQYAQYILKSGTLESKLTGKSHFNGEIPLRNSSLEIEKNPGREQKIVFSTEQAKFPKRGSLHLDDKRAMALHFFANHELLAIEMMAATILKMPTITEDDRRVKLALVKTIEDEQKHFKLYVHRMKDFGLEFGDLPLNDFFWKQIHTIDSFSKYFSLMSLTFESANLDFAYLYGQIFNEVGDVKSSTIMNTVYEDEISHVALGATYLNKWRGDKDLWSYYVENLPELITPMRSKGIVFNRESRIQSGLGEEFVNHLDNFNDGYIVTQRKEWKK